VTSELDLFLAGVVFVRGEDGKLAKAMGTKGADMTGIDLVGAVAERTAAVKAFLFQNERSTVHGICDACACPMALICGCLFCQKRSPADRWKKHGSSSNRSGICWPCERAIQKLIASGGGHQVQKQERAAVDIEALIAALPPKPKAPWEQQ